MTDDTAEDREIRKRIAAWVKTTRERAGENQEAMAEQLHVSQSYISRVERDEQPVMATFVARFCKAYGVDPYQLLYRDPPTEMKPPPRK